MESTSQLESIFFTALEKTDARDRAAFLDGACAGDQALRRRIERMLEAQDASFLHGPPIEGNESETRPVFEAAGALIGPYKLLEQIGEGGMGLVFEAEQERPVRRRVALKVIKPGMDTRQVVARFEAERQALALMDHPNIAKVLDAGPTDTGRPFFVMELVPGVAITEYCDQCRLTTRERLELFVLVCQAVQHAHQKGVIHRDIKPTNVLVAMHDGRTAPKIIDFGVAKAINQRLTEHTLATGFAQMIGTPMYMSPEQAELSPMGVDTRSDIYSLGVLLYELLTGATPFDKDRLQSVSYDELRRIIREEEPSRPSTRIGTLSSDLATTIAERRRTDGRRLAQSIRGELDWIVMQCLEKDRNRRYETAGGLARDIGRYLNDEPVQACPPSASYRLKKFIRRNKIAAAFVLLLAAAVAALSVSNIQTQISRQRAETENAKAQAISALLQGMLRSANPDEAKDADYTVRQLLDDFSASFGAGLPDQKEVEADIRATIGRAYWRLGVADKAEPQLTKAMQLRQELFGPDHESVAQVLVDMAWCRNEQGRIADAVETARDAMHIYSARGTTGTPWFQASAVLQRALLQLNDLDGAKQVTEEAMAQSRETQFECPEIAVILHGQSDLFVKLGLFKDAEDVAREAVKMHRRLNGPSHLETAWGLRALGDALAMQKRYPEAESALRDALAIFRERYRGEHHSYAGTLGSLKKVLAAQKNQVALDAIARDEVRDSIRSDSTGRLVCMAKILLTGNASNEATRAVAHELIQRAIEEYGQVATDYPNDLDRRLKAVDGYIEVADLCVVDPGFAHELDEAHRRLTADFEALPASFPDSTRCLEHVAHARRNWGFVLQGNGKYLSQVELAHREAAKLFEKLSLNNPAEPRHWFFLANTHVLLGDVLSRSARPTDAGRAFQRALDIYDERAVEIAKHATPDSASEIIFDYVRLADYLANARQERGAAEFAHKAAVKAERLIDPAAAIDAFYLLALIQRRLGDEAGYRAACAGALTQDKNVVADKEFRWIWAWCLGPHAPEDLSVARQVAEETVAKFPQDADYLLTLGGVLYRDRQYERAAQQLEASIAANGTGKFIKATVVYSQLFLAMTEWQQGKQDEARRRLAAATPGVDQELQNPVTPWNRRATLEMLRHETEALLGQAPIDQGVQHEDQVDERPGDDVTQCNSS